MSNGPYTITVRMCGDRDEGNAAMDALIAGLKLRAQWEYAHQLLEELPSSVEPVALNAVENSQVEINIPNFTAEPDTEYWLEYSDDDWNTFNPISDMVLPGAQFYYVYNSTRKFRISSHHLGNVAYSMSAGPVS